MRELYELKEMLCDELGNFAGKDLNSATLETVDKLAHAAKNVGKLIEMCESEYSERGSFDGMSNRMSYAEENSYRGRGRNAKRDSMGRYSRDEMSRDGYSRHEDTKALIHEIKLMGNFLPANKQQDLQRIVDKMEQM